MTSHTARLKPRLKALCAHGVTLDRDCELCSLEEYCDFCEGCHLPTLGCTDPVPLAPDADGKP